MRIMLDAGHHESTQGKQTVDGYKEHLFNEGVTNHAATLLKSYSNVEVYHADDEHYDTPVGVRASKANNLNVDVYISVHANAYGSGWNSANGIETYIHPSHTEEEMQLAQKIQRNLVSATGLTNRGVKTADFAVLRETKMTAVLAECGFMTNQREASLIRTADYQQKCATAIVEAIVEQYGLAKSGWSLENGNWYFYKGGVRQTGWLLDSNKWYFLDKNGVMQTGWIQDNNNWYYLESSGAMKTGWIKDKGTWYYLRSNGAMATGVIEDKGKLYYLKDDGGLVVNQSVNVTLNANDDGALGP
jgi:N-acetylmuramoyl-L-alanine amidase